MKVKAFLNTVIAADETQHGVEFAMKMSSPELLLRVWHEQPPPRHTSWSPIQPLLPGWLHKGKDGAEGFACWSLLSFSARRTRVLSPSEVWSGARFLGAE